MESEESREMWDELNREAKHPEHMCECCEMKYKLDERDLCEDCL